MKNPDTNAPRASRCCSCGTVYPPFPEAQWKAQPRKYAIGKYHDGWCNVCNGGQGANREFIMIKLDTPTTI